MSRIVELKSLHNLLKASLKETLVFSCSITISHILKSVTNSGDFENATTSKYGHFQKLFFYTEIFCQVQALKF